MQINPTNRQPLEIRSTENKNKAVNYGGSTNQASSSAQVSISAEAKAHAASSSSGGLDANYRNMSINNAKADPAFGNKLANDFAYSDSFATTGPLIDISARPTLRYTYTGEVVTDQNLAAFKAEAAQARSDKINIYETEKAKGTAPSDILEKLFQYTDTKSESYLSKLGWQHGDTSA